MGTTVNLEENVGSTPCRSCWKSEPGFETMPIYTSIFLYQAYYDWGSEWMLNGLSKIQVKCGTSRLLCL